MEKSSIRKVGLHLGGNGKKPHIQKGSVVAKRSAKKPRPEVPKAKKKARKTDLGGSHPACKPCRIKRLGSRKRKMENDKRRQHRAVVEMVHQRTRQGGVFPEVMDDEIGVEFTERFRKFNEEFIITTMRHRRSWSMVDDNGGDSGLPDGINRFD